MFKGPEAFRSRRPVDEAGGAARWRDSGRVRADCGGIVAPCLRHVDDLPGRNRIRSDSTTVTLLKRSWPLSLSKAKPIAWLTSAVGHPHHCTLHNGDTVGGGPAKVSSPQPAIILSFAEKGRPWISTPLASSRSPSPRSSCSRLSCAGGTEAPPQKPDPRHRIGGIAQHRAAADRGGRPRRHGPGRRRPDLDRGWCLLLPALSASDPVPARRLHRPRDGAVGPPSTGRARERRHRGHGRGG
jgi:hypothetical protein